MGIKRFLSVLLILGMVMTFLAGCANDDANSAQFASDFKQNGKYLFHGLKPGMSLNEVRKKEKLKKSDLIISKDSSAYATCYYTKTDEKLYGIDGNARRTYSFTTNREKVECAGGGVLFYFDDEKKFLKACKQIGNLLRKNCGKPFSDDVIPYDEKQVWDSFMNLPKFSSLNDYIKAHSDYADSSFKWGSPSKHFLYVYHSPRLDIKKLVHFKDDIYNHYIISVVV